MIFDYLNIKLDNYFMFIYIYIKHILVINIDRYLQCNILLKNNN